MGKGGRRRVRRRLERRPASQRTSSPLLFPSLEIRLVATRERSFRLDHFINILKRLVQVAAYLPTNRGTYRHIHMPNPLPNRTFHLPIHLRTYPYLPDISNPF